MKYTVYDSVTTALLDTICIGDMVIFGDEHTPYHVKGVSDNYFICTQNLFGTTYYCICPKKAMEYSHNADNGGFVAGEFAHAPDFWIFGYYSPDKHFYEFNNQDNITEYLSSLESGETKISIRNARGFSTIRIKHCDEV